ncbi:aldo/keto reductase [Clostridium sp. M62/1]|uniref:aldo/keto reductase n=1 Tax=Clostridium sp. M62/1 TaxID=411486 RepID=UPI0001973C9F|nr:aldo/keto reductase [Clostridium sp. M62/1]EFE14197.1 oxidoreductase, aldo/keto reductase family protein [Clostridium sp. M62/1]UEB79073.1 aldo/keto reductase [Clostridium sp. M62/1]
MVKEEMYVLSNGLSIPKLGFGTWFIEDANAAQAVRDAVGAGYRHIDTAQAYGNERGVGEGVNTCGLSRQEIFVTTKLAAEIKTYEEAVEAIDASLEKMGLDYIDLMLIHSPQPWTQFREDVRSFDEGNRQAWKAMEDAYHAGKLKAIGVSNFEKEDLENLLSTCTVKPMVNQLLVHISNTPAELIAYNQANEILVEAYSPIGHGEVLKNPKIQAMAEKYGVSAARLCIRYTLQLGLLPLPKTEKKDHMADNADVDFVISEEDMQILTNIEQIKDYGEFGVFPVYGGKL